MRLFYNIGIHTYNLLVFIAALKSNKAKLWINGRKNWKSQLNSIPDNKRIYWFHCASLGEFEQGRPVIEAIKNQSPETFILITFYSPSGYEIRKNYEHADLIMYLPADTSKNATLFIDKVNPDAAFFIKYEFWFNYIQQLHKRNIKLYSISAIFRPNQLFFKSGAAWFRKHLNYFTHFFVQNKQSKTLLENLGISQVTISGDTRYDRVYDIAKANERIPIVEEFSKNHFTVIAGSTWEPENEMLIKLANNTADNVRIVIAPHELHEKTYEKIENNTQAKVVRFSKATPESLTNSKILIIDNIGLLSKLYRYGTIALIGGGFGKGIHNILEPAVYGLPVLFGPNYKKFHEAKTMVNKEIGFAFTDFATFEKTVTRFLNNTAFLNTKIKETTSFVDSQLGATNTIVKHIDI
ncbi:MAG: glycosyltransferase N-terminal domain-containing protein [Salinivirgaceae bacterium]